MEIRLHKDFKKTYNKLPKKTQKQLDERLLVFLNDVFDPILNNHTLKGKYRNCRSINISGDLRAIYTIKGDAVIFLKIGTHSELYG